MELRAINMKALPQIMMFLAKMLQRVEKFPGTVRSPQAKTTPQAAIPQMEPGIMWIGNQNGEADWQN